MMARRQSGFTMIEALITVAVTVALGMLAFSSLWRLRPRAHLADASSELASLVYGARQEALATGNNVAVLVFPGYAGPNSTGRVIVYEDGDFTLFNAAAIPNFANYNPAAPPHGPNSTIISTWDVPFAVTVGPATGMGAAAVLPAPFAAIPVNVDCSFCANLAFGRAGAVVFDAHGWASFYSNVGAPIANLTGGSLSLAAPDVNGQRTLIITSATGSVTLWNTGG
ncbi:MAG TPA: prepilin-type N-terminal cleavage/methylation domain-containing protein [Anaeromyxobacteraceae bacterium]|nr:prepilin-type N-terminal cleavage/methylation domain-containing protein [Anaeromyxobacteraceae bacterium]